MSLLNPSSRRLAHVCGIVGGIVLGIELLYATLEGQGFPLSLGYWFYTLLVFALLVGTIVALYRQLRTHTPLSGFQVALIGGWIAAVVKIAVAGSIPFLNPYLWISVPFIGLLVLGGQDGLFERVNHPVWCLVFMLTVIISTSFFRRFWLYASGVPVGASRRMTSEPLSHPGWWLTGFSSGNLLVGLGLALGTTGMIAGMYRLGIPLVRWIRRHRGGSLAIVLALLLTTGLTWELTRETPTRRAGSPGTSFSGTLPEGEGSSPGIDELPNLVLVSIDTLRWDAVHGGTASSPIPESLRRDSLAFTRLISTSGWTLPAHASLFSGRIPVRHGAVRFGSRIRSDVPLYPQYLRRMGYRTAGFTDGILVGKQRGFGRGHEVYWEQPAPGHGKRYTDFVPGVLEIGSVLLKGTRFAFPVRHGIHDLLSADQLRYFRHNVDRAISWIQRGNGSRPFYVFLHSYQVHDHLLIYPKAFRALRESNPQQARALLRGLPLPSAQQFTRSNPEHHRLIRALHHLYRHGVDPVKGPLRRLTRFLKDRGDYRNTLIVVLSDHGEGFSLDPRMLFHGKGQLGEVLLRVPMLVKPPRPEPEPDRVDAPLQITDVFPLMGRLTGFEFPREPGVSEGMLNGILTGSKGRRITRGSSQHHHRAGHGPVFYVRSNRYKIVSDRGSDVTQYYRVRTSPPGQQPVSPMEVPEPVREDLRVELRRLLSTAAEHSNPYRKPDARMDPELTRELKGMGYL